MLNELSCFYFDWSAIGAVGTWVGGVGAVLAAVIALWIAQRDARQRRKFAEFLFRKDVGRISELLTPLKTMEKHLRNWRTHNENERHDIRSGYSQALQTFEKLVGSFEYLNQSNQQFYFRPQIEVVSRLIAMAGRLHRLGASATEVRFAVDEFVAADYVKDRAQEISSVLGSLKELGLYGEGEAKG